jgi:hypothetical protein
MPPSKTSGRPGETTQARVYVNGHVVDVRSTSPTVADCMRAAGYDPGRHDAYRLRGPQDRTGEPIPMDTVLHLDKEGPVFLRCVPRPSKESRAPSVVPSLTAAPDDALRSIGMKDLNPPAGPEPMSPPEPPGPPGL